MTRGGAPVPAGPLRLGSALIAATLLLRGDVALMLGEAQPREPPPPPDDAEGPLRVELPVPAFRAAVRQAVMHDSKPAVAVAQRARRGVLLGSTSMRPVPVVEPVAAAVAAPPAPVAPDPAPARAPEIDAPPPELPRPAFGMTFAAPDLSPPNPAPELEAAPAPVATPALAEFAAAPEAAPAPVAEVLPIPDPAPPVALAATAAFEHAEAVAAVAAVEVAAAVDAAPPVAALPAVASPAVASPAAKSDSPSPKSPRADEAEPEQAPAATDGAPLHLASGDRPALPGPAFGAAAMRTTAANLVILDPPVASAAMPPRDQHTATAGGVDGSATKSPHDPPARAAAAAPGDASPVTAALVLPRPLFGQSTAASPTAPSAAPSAARPVAALSPVPGRQSFPVSDSTPVQGYDDELILEIKVAGTPGNDTVVAYGTREGIYLPLGDIARLLDLAITVSDDGHFASGWFLDEARTISLDLRQGRATVKGHEVPLGKGDAIAFDGELYLRAERFADYFPLTVTPDLRDQAINISTLEPFPFEERMKREAERARLGSQGRQEAPRWPREETPWRALSLPMLDMEMRAVSDSALGTRGETDVRVAGDIAWLTGQAFVGTTTRDGLVSAHVEVGRRDPDAQLLGPLKATEFQIGDIATLTLPLGLRGSAGRGFAVSNAPLEAVSVFDRLDLRGILPNDHDVELYRNDVLLGSTRQSVNGQYEFLQVPVDYGINVFRLVFHGPQGQRSEEVRRISVGDGRLAAGQAVYSFGMAQKDVNLLGVTGPRFTPGLDYGRWRASGELSYGLSAGLTASLSGAWFESERGQRQMAGAGLRTSLLGMAAKLDLGLQDGGARAIGAGLGGRLLGTSFTLSHVEYRGEFLDEVKAFTGDYLKRATELDFNANIDLGSAVIPVSGRMRRRDFRDGRADINAALRASMRFAGLMASNTLDYSRTHNPLTPASQQLVGNFDLATLSRSRLQGRASLGYKFLPGARITSAGLEASYKVDDRTLLHGMVAHSLEDQDTQFGVSASRRFGPVALSFDGSYGLRAGTYAVGLRLGFSLGRNPQSRGFYLAQPGEALSGAVAMRAFHDRNADGRYDAGDEVLPDVAFTGGVESAHTDARGVALIGGLGSGSRTSVQIDMASLPDIAFAPVTRGIEIVPRPGRIHASDFAIQELSEVEGTAWFADSESTRGVSGLRLRLIGKGGTPVHESRTESDGFFLFDGVRPGQYRVELDPDQAARLGIMLAAPADLIVGPVADVVRLKLVVARSAGLEGSPPQTGLRVSTQP